MFIGIASAVLTKQGSSESAYTFVRRACFIWSILGFM